MSALSGGRGSGSVGNGRRFGSVGDGRCCRVLPVLAVADRDGVKVSAVVRCCRCRGRDRDGLKVSAVVGVAMVAATVGRF